MIAAGSLNKRITLLAPSTVQVQGGKGPETVFATCWASLDSIAGQKAEQMQLVSESTHKITIRYRTGVTPSMRVQFGSRLFTILYVANEKERDENLALFCQENL